MHFGQSAHIKNAVLISKPICILTKKKTENILPAQPPKQVNVSHEMG